MITDRFQMPAKLKMTGIALLIVGLLSLLIGAFTLLGSNDPNHEIMHADKTRFWLVLMHNSVFFLLVVLASVFIQAAVTLAQGGWILAWKRVTEAIGANVLVFGLIAAVILIGCVFFFNVDGHNPIYHWTHPEGDAILEGKKAFLNPTMFAVFTIVTIGLWAFFGKKFRSLSLAQESAPKGSTKIYWRTVTVAGLFLVVYALTQMSVSPWLWIMSIDAHWYSTMFSWYTFASAFVSGMSMVLLWVIYLKSQDNLKLVTNEHLHDLGKLMFAFSIFWTYVWFAQYMLIWYSNIPEETIYFKMRQEGPYKVIWYATFIINFVAPILILMSRDAKRNYFTLSFMACLIIFGHWLDFYIMMMPGPLGAHWHLSWYEIGIFLGFIGVVILTVGNTLTKSSLITHNHPLLKETVIHLS